MITPSMAKEYEQVLRSMKWSLTSGTWPASVRRSFTGKTSDHLWVSCCIVIVEDGRVFYKGGLSKITVKEHIILPLNLVEIAVYVAEKQVKEEKEGEGR
jgi:hypothetical protein